MTHLDFCYEVDKSEIALISGGQYNTETSQQETYYFFPALVSLQCPTENCQTIIDNIYKFGWWLQCKSGEYLTSQFLHVLLLRLAFTYVSPSKSPPPDKHPLRVEHRQCNVWKNGIHWQNMDGVETIVEVVEQNTAVLVVMGCLEGSQVKCVQLRSAVIQTILSAKKQYSGAIDMKESLLHPDELTKYPLKMSKIFSPSQ